MEMGGKSALEMFEPLLLLHIFSYLVVTVDEFPSTPPNCRPMYGIVSLDKV